VREANKALRTSNYRWMLATSIPDAVRRADEKHEKEIREAISK
jgi:hypothetical protein